MIEKIDLTRSCPRNTEIIEVTEDCISVLYGKEGGGFTMDGIDCPIIIGEFHMGALDRGLLATGLKGVRSQEDRAKAWRFVCEQVAAHPYGVGAHWHMFCDNSVVGWYDGENYNNGMIDVCTKPYEELNGAMHDSMSRIYEVYEGKKAPYSEKAERIPMIAY